MDKSKLLANRTKTVDIELEGLGVVTVRSLTRAETHSMGKANGNEAKMEQMLLHFGMVDPELTEAEVKAWQEVANTGDIQVLVEAILELSGMGAGSDKAAYKSTGK